MRCCMELLQPPGCRAPCCQPPPLNRAGLARRPPPPPLQEAGWKHTTRCALVGVVGGTALLLAMLLPALVLTFVRQGIPLDRMGDVARLKPGECLSLEQPQERMVCRRELDNFSKDL